MVSSRSPARRGQFDGVGLGEVGRAGDRTPRLVVGEETAVERER